MLEAFITILVLCVCGWVYVCNNNETMSASLATSTIFFRVNFILGFRFEMIQWYYYHRRRCCCLPKRLANNIITLLRVNTHFCWRARTHTHTNSTNWQTKILLLFRSISTTNSARYKHTHTVNGLGLVYGYVVCIWNICAVQSILNRLACINFCHWNLERS